MPRMRRCREPGCYKLVALPHVYCLQHRDKEAVYFEQRQKWHRARDNKHKQFVYNTITRNRDDIKQQQYLFYRSKRWTSLRKQALARDHYLCQYCLAQGITTPAKTVDHTVPIEWEPSRKADLENLVTICSHCHRLKTNWEQSYYGTGKNQKLKRNVKAITDVASIVLLMQQ